MAIRTIKTRYYYKLLEEVKGIKQDVNYPPGYSPEKSIIEPVEDEKTDETLNAPKQRDQYQRLPTMEMPPVTPGQKTQQDDIYPPPRDTRKLSNLIQNVSIFLGKRVNKAFPVAKIHFKNGELAGRDFFIFNINPSGSPPGGFVKIGRLNPQGEQHFITLSQQTISRFHAKIVYLNEKLVIVNYSQVNPAEVNGKKIPPNTSVYLPEGAVISVGGVEFTVEKLKLNTSQPGVK